MSVPHTKKIWKIAPLPEFVPTAPARIETTQNGIGLAIDHRQPWVGRDSNPEPTP